MAQNTPPRHSRTTPGLISSKIHRWPPWYWPWWMVLVALQIPIVGGAYVMGALSTLSQAHRAILRMQHTLISGSPNAIQAAMHSHNTWIVDLLLVSLGVAIGVLIGHRSRRENSPDHPWDAATVNASEEAPVASRRLNPWLRELLAAVLWACLVGGTGYFLIHTGSQLIHGQLAQLPFRF